MMGTQMDCEEKQRLLKAYDEASSELSNSVTALRSHQGTTSQAEYEVLYRASRDAHIKAEQARVTFERHKQDHNC
ncbi:MAG: hypothetical protein JWQ49_4813 [Edaphobacter sp.]|jgi:hypothetical protein|nr:hypothetical protein [Edaphobacter sp.]